MDKGATLTGQVTMLALLAAAYLQDYYIPFQAQLASMHSIIVFAAAPWQHWL